METNEFVNMMNDLGISKPTIILKINTVKLLHKHLKLIKSSLSLNKLKKFTSDLT